VAKGDLKKVQKLLNILRDGEKAADINYCDENGLSALHTAIKYNQYDALILIMSTGLADVNMPTYNVIR
jgi:ankyrin repeat protein